MSMEEVKKMKSEKEKARIEIDVRYKVENEDFDFGKFYKDLQEYLLEYDGDATISIVLDI